VFIMMGNFTHSSSISSMLSICEQSAVRPFLVAEQTRVTRLLGALMRRGVVCTVRAVTLAEPLRLRITADGSEPSRIVLLPPSDAHALRHLLRATVIHLAHDAKSRRLQWTIDAPQLISTPEGTGLMAALPSVLIRLPRRAMIRRATAPSTHAHVRRVGRTIRCRVLDLSLHGAGLVWPPGEPLPAVGDVLLNVRIDALGSGPIELHVRHADAGRVGGAFMAPEPARQAMLQASAGPGLAVIAPAGDIGRLHVA
jgi:hypothetical protein